MHDSRFIRVTQTGCSEICWRCSYNITWNLEVQNTVKQKKNSTAKEICGPEQQRKNLAQSVYSYKCITISNTLKFPHLNSRILLALLYEDNVLSKTCLYSGESNVNLSWATGQKSITHKGVSKESINVSIEFHISFLLTCMIAYIDEFKPVAATKDCNWPFSTSVITRTGSTNVN